MLCSRAKKKLDQATTPGTFTASSLSAIVSAGLGRTGVVVMRKLRDRDYVPRWILHIDEG
jgi:hypothetical protein